MEDDLEKNTFFGIKPDSTRTVPIIVGCVVLVFIAAVIATAKFFIESNQPRIDLLYTPESAVVTLDGNVVKSGEIVLSAGMHEIKAEKFGFEPEEVTVEVGWGEATPVHIVLSPNTDESSDWYNENEEDGRIVEGITGYKYDDELDETMQQYPILNKLPIYEEDFYIYHQACDEPVCILIDTNEDYYDEAIKYFREELDDDIGKYRFVFYDYSNPFLGEG